MSALTQARFGQTTSLKNVALPIAAGATVYLGGIACIDTAAAIAKNAVAGTATLIPVGEWLETVDNSAGTATVYAMCNLTTELWMRWYDSDTGGNAVTASNLYATVYLLDDHTVTTTVGSNSKAGRVWAVDAVKGIGVVTVVPNAP